MSKQYEVIGTQPILGHEPGSTFSADLPPEQEDWFFSINALKAVERKDVTVKAPVVNPYRDWDKGSA